MDFFFHLLALLGLFVLSGFFAGAETAIFSLSKIERRRVEKIHTKPSRWLSHLLEHPRQTLITILICNVLINILATSIATLWALHYWGPRWIGLALTGFTVFLIFFGEIAPKIVAVPNNETLALVSAFPIRVLAWLLYPVNLLFRNISDHVLTLLAGKHKIQSDQISEDELKAIIKMGAEDGVLDRQERYMIQKLFELGERPVKDIMTPRVHLKGIDVENSREEHIALIRQYHYSHFPVYKETTDNILGVVSSQDFMLNRDAPLENIMTQPLFVPETKRIDDLLTELKTKKENFVVCVDEYGGTAGIATLEDILEEIFGEYYDEYEEVENPIHPRGRNEYMIDAKISLLDFNEYFATHLEAEEASTLGGFILEKLGEVPKRGRTLTTEECEIQVQEVLRGRQIRTVLVRIKK